MVQTNIAASSPLVSPLPGPAAAPADTTGAGAASPDGASASFAAVLGKQRHQAAGATPGDGAPNKPGAQSDPDSPVADALAALLPFLPAGADWLGALRGRVPESGGGSDDKRTKDASPIQVDSGPAAALTLGALPVAAGGASTAATALSPGRVAPAPVASAAPSVSPATTLAEGIGTAGTGTAPAPSASTTPSAGSTAVFALPGTARDPAAQPSAIVAAPTAADAAMAQAITADPGFASTKSAASLADGRSPDPATALPTMVAAPHASTAVASAQTDLRIATPMGGRQWESAVGNSLVLMAGNQQHHAELVLTPPQLGRIEVSLSMAGDQATAVFVSPNPAVRDALESAMPRLREILADAGVTLGQVQVGAESFRQSAGHGENGDNPGRDPASGRFGDLGSARVVAAIGTSTPGATRSLVDVFV